MRRKSWKDRLRYWFDNFMSRGGSSIFISLLALFLAAWVALGLMRLLLAFWRPFDGIYGADSMQSMWVIFLQLTAPSNMRLDIASTLTYKLIAMAAGLMGVVIFSMLIAFITTSLNRKLAYLRKGHSLVIETGHTLILGWNERLIEIVSALAIAKENEANPAVVVLADRDKEEMDDVLEMHVKRGRFPRLRVVTRKGRTSSLAALEKVAAGESEAVIILAECSDSDDSEQKTLSDTRVIKTVLALLAGRPKGKLFRIVAELYEERNRQLVEQLARNSITTFDTHDILAKILVQTSRSSGLSVVYNELFSFEGSEIYFFHAPWQGLSFAQLQFHFLDGVPIGLMHEDGSVIINPPCTHLVGPFDQVVIVARDNSNLRFEASPVAAPQELPLKPGRLQPVIERNLILGWNHKAPTIISEYEDYVLEGSSITVVLRRASPQIRIEIEQLKQRLERIELLFLEADPLDADALLELEPFAFNNIIILSQDGTSANPEKTDTETILLLLLLRNIFEKHQEQARYTKLITEVLDSENKELISKAGVNDFIISNRFVSMIIAQYSEQPAIQKVYATLFQEAGSEIYLKPAALYFEHLPQEVSFADLMGLVQKREEICIGIKLKELEQDSSRNYGVELVPPKDRRITLRAGDSLVVVAEDDT